MRLVCVVGNGIRVRERIAAANLDDTIQDNSVQHKQSVLAECQ